MQNTVQNVQSNPLVQQTFLEGMLDKGFRFMHRHPTTTKVILVAGVVLSAIAVAACIAGHAIIPGIGVGLVGCYLLAALVGAYVFSLMLGSHHDMKDHVFTPASYGKARLYYQKDIPILEIISDDPYQAGHDHGYLMGPYLEKMLSKVNFVKRLADKPQCKNLPQTLQAIQETIPKEYLEEMKGVVEGFNSWRSEHNLSIKGKCTIEDLLLFHLMPDEVHFNLRKVERRFPICCTTVLATDPKEGMVFGRNLDWPSFGILGTMSCVLHRKYQEGKYSTVEVGFPGFLGTVTGMNDAGLGLAMNVCPGLTLEVRGMPASFYNRMCLESASSLKEIKDIFQKQLPLGPYHLTVADQATAASFNFRQWNVRPLERIKKEKEPLVTTNDVYRDDTTKITHECENREKIIAQLFQKATTQASPGALVRASLALPYVNNIGTTHQVVMYPQSRRMQVAFDNAFCADTTLHELEVYQL